ncbi:RagB/SusD family nutrient uptake outer membrane protein [Flavihumibacter petaseus]|uniref:RagB/SusD family nutrient uptake outer membrane protein n=1 Tax=Flavihumibacter petaseus NBRC 106054 TaxID=1220578 RepID=A0A0E9MYT8_9BACT|nr:RagB/SusD family nutrient uptake outer membrane protein [Flavihumibacter petaseus]GAO42774.1 hypothetical protein FPE01S_01_17920 [Flavihumibacter petaseus NBRC 106054]
MVRTKNILRTAVIVLGFSATLAGCKKFLDRAPLSVTVDDIKVGALEGKVLGLYGAVRNSKSDPYCGDGFEGIAWIGMNGFRSDDAEIVADPGATAWHQTYDNFQYTKDDWGAGLYWDKHFVFVGLCNDALDEAEKGGYSDPASLINIAEAKFFRAYAYFDLVRTYGAVPLIDFKINDPKDGQVEKSDTAAVYDLIRADLTEAAAVLPLVWEAKYIGRLTSGAAKTFLAKVDLYQKQYDMALSLCREVINSGQYRLHKPYYEIFRTQGELNDESIFEIQAYKVAGDGDTYWSRLGQAQGIRGASGGPWDLGWGWNTPTEALVASYEKDDARKAATILESGKSDGGPSTGGYGQTLPVMSNAKYWNKKVYNQYSDYLAAGLGTPNNEAQNTWVNHRVFRYADVLLMAAEAATIIGGDANLAEALGYVNQVRDRADLPELGPLTQSDLLKAVKQERRVEFAMEFERFFDLVRWGDAQTVLGNNGYTNKHRYYPIPVSAMNANPNLTQNPEW